MRWSLRRGSGAILFSTLAALGLVAIGIAGTPGLAGAATGFGSQVAATQWTSTNPPALPGGNGFDESVSCVSSSFCVATTAGIAAENSSGTPAVVQIWNGSTWTSATMPVPHGTQAADLSSVSCTSAISCVAVGAASTSSDPMTAAFQSFADEWNGSGWFSTSGLTVPSGFSNTQLNSVSCTGPAWCMAIGEAMNTTTSAGSAYAEQWNGSTWTLSALASAAPADNTLSGISCTTPSNCMAVGSSTTNGPNIRPNVQTGPLGTPGTPGQFDFPVPGLHANAESHVPVMTVLAEQWNGTSWSVSPAVGPGTDVLATLVDVSCAGSGFCMATGEFDIDNNTTSTGFSDVFSGGAWSTASFPASTTGGILFMEGVSCVSPTSCTAVGESTFSMPNGNGTQVGASWNGSGWTLTTEPLLVGAVATAWFGVSCLTGGFCVAAGGFATGSGATVPSNDQAPIARTGYRLAASDGGVFSYGPASPNLGAPFAGSMGGMHLNAPIVGMATMPSGDGYFLVASDGGIFNFGSAPFEGSTGGTHLNQPIVGMAVTADGGGYWLVASDGGVFSYGDAQFYGSAGSTHLNKPIVGMAATPNGLGYYLVASDGGVFTYGNAVFAGSTGGTALNKPIVGMAVTPAGGYNLVASDGGVFTYGGAPFLGSAGSLKLNKPVVGMGVADGGYYLVGSDGGIFTYGTSPSTPVFFGSAGSLPLQAPIVGIGV